MEHLKKLLRKIDDEDLTDFEKKHLIPMIIDRLKHYLESFEGIVTVCNDVRQAELLDAPVREAVNLLAEEFRDPFPNAGINYLKKIQHVIQTGYIHPLKQALERFPNSEAVKSGDDFFKLLQYCQALVSSIIASENRVITVHLKNFGVIRDPKTDQQIVLPPISVELISYPFLSILKEIISSAQTTHETLQNWRKDRNEWKKRFIDFEVAQKQIESAQEQVKLTKELNRFQLLVILFTITLTMLSAPLTEALSKALKLILNNRNGPTL